MFKKELISQGMDDNDKIDDKYSSNDYFSNTQSK